MFFNILLHEFTLKLNFAFKVMQLQRCPIANSAKLEQAQAAPEAQRVNILQGLTGDQLIGDLLTAPLWGYFAAVQSHGAIASSQAQMIDRPALSYGLFHAQVRPNKLYGIVTTGITFQGLNMDIGHMRSIRWVKDDDPNAQINNKPELTSNGKSAAQNRWIAYNKIRGQYASAMEHAVPEQFWVDKSQCRYNNEQGQVQNPTKADCAQAVSAVKAIAIAQAEGQRIYTIDQSNAATALPQLPVGGTVGEEIRSAIQAGKEVTVHERQISAHGFTGFGYIITDPQTGAGAYLIEGKGNGGIFLFVAIVFFMLLFFIPAIVGAVTTAVLISTVTTGIAFFVGFLLLAMYNLGVLTNKWWCQAGASIATGTIASASFSSILLRIGQNASNVTRALLSGDFARVGNALVGGFVGVSLELCN